MLKSKTMKQAAYGGLDRAVCIHGLFINQVHASRRPVCTWFLKIDSVWIVAMHVCVCVCVPVPEAINN